jgi:hypothetical protein
MGIAYGDYYYLRPGTFVFKISPSQTRKGCQGPDEISDDIATPPRG